MSSAHDLPQLHKITVDRFAYPEYRACLVHNLSPCNYTLLDLLLEANSLVDVGLLSRADPEVHHDDGYLIAPLQDLLMLPIDLDNAHGQLAAVLQSRSFRLGRAITRVPRYIRGLARTSTKLHRQ